MASSLFQGADALTTNRDLLRLIERSKAFVASMTPEAREAYFADQRRRAVLAEMAMPNEDATVTVC